MVITDDAYRSHEIFTQKIHSSMSKESTLATIAELNGKNR